MKNLFGFLLFLCLTSSQNLIFAQGTSSSKDAAIAKIKANNLLVLQKYEDTLKRMGDSLLAAESDAVRQKTAFLYIKKLVAALKTPQSYLYPFDSLRTVSITESPDDKFRTFTMAIQFDNGSSRYYGAIQMHDEKKLQLVPLIDYSPAIRKYEDTTCSAKTWYGNIIYKIVPLKVGKTTYYTLFGWKAVNPMECRKMMDMMHFDENQQPIFGEKAMIHCKNFDSTMVWRKRFVLPYNCSAAVSLNYDAENNRVMFDHLVTKAVLQGKTNMPGRQRGYDQYPDGTYEGFKWEKDHWEYLADIPSDPYQTAPVPVPFFDKQR
jgi:hypothetical protein